MSNLPVTVPEDSIPEVKAYMDELNYLKDYCAAKADVVATLRTLIDRVNASAQQAEKVVRARGVFCGPWQKHNTKKVLNTELLIDRIGVERFVALGGVQETKPTYKIDRERVELAIAKKELTAAEAQDIIREEISYKKTEVLRL
jgi:hypothetical protein